MSVLDVLQPNLVQQVVSHTTSATLVLGERGQHMSLNSSSAQNLTVPPNGSVALKIGSIITGHQESSGVWTIVAGVGVTIVSATGSFVTAANQSFELKKVGANKWVLTFGPVAGTAISTIDANNSAVTISGTTKTALYSFTLPANALGTTKTARIELAGEFQRSGTSGTMAIEVKLGSTVLFADTSASITTIASVLHAWFFSIDLSAAAATNAQFCSGMFNMGPAVLSNPPTSGTSGDLATVPTAATGLVAAFTGSAAEDQTTDLTFTVSITMNTASTTLNFIKRKAIAYLLGAGAAGSTGATGTTGASGAGTGNVPANVNGTVSGTTYSTDTSDVDHETQFSSSSAVTITVVAASHSAGNCSSYRQLGTGQVSFVADSGVTLRVPSGAKIRAQYCAAVLRCDSSGVYFLDGAVTV